jgi:cation diffusion facilitator family transporter
MTNVLSDTSQPFHGEREKRLVAFSSVLAAVFLTSMKIVIGVLTGSLGILSEAAHSGLDLVAAVVTFFAVRLSSRPPDRRLTYGYGKVENISALFETVLLLVTCIWIIYEAIQRLFFKNVRVEASLWAFVVISISIAIDYTRSRALSHAARKYASQALEADALHFSTDIWSSSVVIVGLALVWISDRLEISWLVKADAIAAMGVAGIVIYISLRLGRRTIADLVDAIPPGLRDEVHHAVQGVPGVSEVRRVRIRRSGPDFFTDVSVLVNRETALEKAHEIATLIEETVRSILPRCEDVVVNVIPAVSDDEGMITRVRLMASRFGLGAHSIRIYDVLGDRSMELHLEVQEALSVEQAHQQVSEFEEALRHAMPGVVRIVTHIEPSGDQTATRRARPVDEAKLRQVLEKLPRQFGLRYQPHEVVINRAGGELSLSFHCVLDGSLAITDAHQLTEQLEAALRAQVPALSRVIIHVEPANTEMVSPVKEATVEKPNQKTSIPE